MFLNSKKALFTKAGRGLVSMVISAAVILIIFLAGLEYFNIEGFDFLALIKAASSQLCNYAKTLDLTSFFS